MQLHLRASFTKLNDTSIIYNVRNLETDLALPRPKTNLVVVEIVVVGIVVGKTWWRKERKMI